MKFNHHDPCKNVGLIDGQRKSNFIRNLAYFKAFYKKWLLFIHNNENDNKTHTSPPRMPRIIKIYFFFVHLKSIHSHTSSNPIYKSHSLLYSLSISLFAIVYHFSISQPKRKKNEFGA